MMMFQRFVFAVAVTLATFLVTVRPSAAMNFRLEPVVEAAACKSRACPQVIVATGEIGSSSAEDLLAFLRANRDKHVSRVILMHSPGGALIGGLKLGIVLRAAKASLYVGQVVQKGGVPTAIAGGCYSACVFAMMGASQRFVLPTCRVGIHRGSYPGPNDDGPIATLLQQRRVPGKVLDGLRIYAKRMGVDPRIVDMGEKVGPGGVHILTMQEVAQLRLAKVTR